MTFLKNGLMASVIMLAPMAAYAETTDCTRVNVLRASRVTDPIVLRVTLHVLNGAAENRDMADTSSWPSGFMPAADMKPLCADNTK